MKFDFKLGVLYSSIATTFNKIVSMIMALQSMRDEHQMKEDGKVTLAFRLFLFLYEWHHPPHERERLKQWDMSSDILISHFLIVGKDGHPSYSLHRPNPRYVIAKVAQ